MADNRKIHITKLRDVASTHQWDECRENVKFLLPHMTEVGVVLVLSRQLERFLVNAHNTYPNDEDILVELSQLEDISSFKSLFESATSINRTLEKWSNKPGINNFRNALKWLLRLDLIEPSFPNYHDAIIDVLSGILMAILDQEWGQNNQDLWHRTFWQETPEDAFIRVKHFWSNPKTLQLNKELWYAVADDIESNLVW